MRSFPSPPITRFDGVVTGERRGRRLVVRGEVDAATAAPFAELLARASVDPGIDVVDLRGITFFDSRGADVLQRFELHRHRQVIGSHAVAKVLRILGTPWLLTEFADAA